ncbi:unnamed protein product [Symbiodinium natans]|uniref:Uncharacterized protein n=1 Tax=Symbiodinium natans TaxID=878477 RepID=A0A812PSW2_9DINO|nr:unnamed protein product [Symbiodinium natans]
MASSSAAGGARGVGAASDVDAAILRATLTEAAFSSGRAKRMVLPWEEGGLELIFGESTLDTMLSVVPSRVEYPTPDVPAEPVESQARVAKRARLFDPDRPCFADVIRFNMKVSDQDLEDGRWRKGLEKWFVLLTEDPSVSLVGSSVCGLPLVDAFQVLRELFGLKSASTVDKRASSLMRFIKWMHAERPFGRAFPFNTKSIDEYVKHLKEMEAKVGAVDGFFEAVRFAVHVVGVSHVEESHHLFSPWSKGYQGLLQSRKPERVKAAVLKVEQVFFLENFLRDDKMDIQDRYADGCFLFCLYSRSRISDIRQVHSLVWDVVGTGDQITGFIECATRCHKTAKQAAVQGVSMPLVAPINGIADFSWGLVFKEVAESAGLPLDAGRKGPLLPAPDECGGWTQRSVSTVEAGEWLRALLEKGSMLSSGVSGHSLKHTTLDWCGKFGLEDVHQTLLGHHSLKKATMYAYMRDKLASPLREYERMLNAVKHSLFLPDSTRSGLFPAGEASEHSGPAPFGLFGAAGQSADGSLEGSPGLVDLEVGAGPIEEGGVGEEQSDAEEGSSSSSSSSSSSESSEDDWVGGLDAMTKVHVPLTSLPAITLEHWQHQRTRTIHTCAVGTSSGLFMCGRKQTSDFRLIDVSSFYDVRLCEVCRKSKPLKDSGSVVAALEQAQRGSE